MSKQRKPDEGGAENSGNTQRRQKSGAGSPSKGKKVE
jgi:hypothetical protein